jgi:hypothetical protein
VLGVVVGCCSGGDFGIRELWVVFGVDVLLGERFIALVGRGWERCLTIMGSWV